MIHGSTPSAPLRPADLVLGFGSGALLTSMVFLNGTMGQATNAYFSSLAAHLTGTIAAGIALLLVRLRHREVRPADRTDALRPRPGAPLWSYLAGLAGAVTVMLTSTTVNSPLALSGTLALGLAGQAGFALLSDRLGLFGLPRRPPGLRQIAALGLILVGSAIIILAGSAG